MTNLLSPEIDTVNATTRSTMTSAVSILIGVAGHRDLDPRQRPALLKRVECTLRKIQNDYPNTPLAVLSPLLTGADQLVAEVALDLKRRQLADIRLVAVLPWKDDLSLPDDDRYEDSRKLGELLASADLIVTMPLRQGIAHADLARDAHARDQQRDEAGRYIARHSQILLALWDGQEHRDSRTTRMIRWHREGGPAPFLTRFSVLDSVEPSAICHLRVSRTGARAGGEHDSATTCEGSDTDIPVQWFYPQYQHAGYSPAPPRNVRGFLGRGVRRSLLFAHHLLEVRWWFVEKGAPGRRELEARWKAMDRFNQDVARLYDRVPDQLLLSRGYLMSAETSDRAPDGVDPLSQAYALADVAAGQFQTHTKHTVTLLFLIALTAIGALEVYAHFLHEWPLLAAYLFLLGIGWGLFRWMRFSEQQGRWLDYRALAEALRVQIYWRIAELPDCVADHYLRHFRGELDWIRHATRSAFLMSGGHTVDEPRPLVQDAELLRFVQRDWLRDQYHYFEKKAPVNTELEISFETVTRLAFLAAVLVAAYHLWFHLRTDHMSHGLVLGTFACLVVAALVEEFGEFQAYALLSRKYGWMINLYGSAIDRIDECFEAGPAVGDLHQIRTVLFDVGCEALTENAEWVVQHRQRPPMLPRG